MSKIQIAELQEAKSELNLLDVRETTAITGGRNIRNDIVSQLSNIVQVNNSIIVQVSFGGDNTAVANLTNVAGANQQSN